MADTFAYNPPGLPPAHSYGPAPPFQAAGAYGAIEDLSDEDRGTSLGTGSTSVDGYKHDELLPRGGSTSPPPLAPSLYSYGANVRSEMRPMTAPSSTSAPYFHAAHYSNAGSSNASAFGAPQHAATYYSYASENPAAQAAEEYRRQYYAAGLRGDHYAGLPDEPRYRDTSTEPTFQHSIPPQQQQQRYYEPVQSGSPDDGAYSRPRTGESRPRSTQPPLPLTSSHAESAHPSKLYEQSERHEDGAYQDPEVDELETKAYSFVTTAGQAPKRPRRRYEEIERLYTCDYHGCQKAYGTLNHLNSHKTMQRHGPKSTPARPSLRPTALVADSLQNSRSSAKPGGTTKRQQQRHRGTRPSRQQRLCIRNLPLASVAHPRPAPSSPMAKPCPTTPSPTPSPSALPSSRPTSNFPCRRLSSRQATAGKVSPPSMTVTVRNRSAPCRSALRIAPSPRRRTSRTRQALASTRRPSQGARRGRAATRS